MPDVELTEEQREAAEVVWQWVKTRSPEISLGGYAGTGKTTMVRYLLQTMPGCRVLAPTGKAASVLRSKGIGDAATIHSMFYTYVGKVVKKESTGETKPVFEAKEEIEYDGMVIVDESSMVNAEMAYDLRKHGLRIIWIGDHGQLPPVGGDPGIMRSPTVTLNEIHRQAKDNPIVRLAHRVRQGEAFRRFSSPDERVAFADGERSAGAIVTGAIDRNLDIVLVGFNAIRHKVNAEFRARLGFVDTICPGDRVICLHNDRNNDIFNGQTFRVDSVGDASESTRDQFVTITDDDGSNPRVVRMFLPRFGRNATAIDDTRDHGVGLFDYAYAITCHKAQGSEWSRVGLVDCTCPMWENERWRYTAVTRAKDFLTVFR